MVNYLTLPGQAGASGNAASGAALLNALQNSPLSGRYTAFNFYLQSAVDAGTLGGVQAQAGGQVYADAASYLVRQAQRVAEAVAPYTAGRDLAPGQARLWLAGFGGNFRSDAASGAAASSEYGAGSVAGATFRLGDKASASLGLGTTWGSVESAGARATVGTVLGTAAGRYGFSGLDAGPFAAADVLAGWVGHPEPARPVRRPGRRHGRNQRRRVLGPGPVGLGGAPVGGDPHAPGGRPRHRGQPGRLQGERRGAGPERPGDDPGLGQPPGRPGPGSCPLAAGNLDRGPRPHSRLRTAAGRSPHERRRVALRHRA